MSSPNRHDKLSTVLATFWEEISPKVDAYAIPAVQSRIAEWAGSSPELTEVLCQCAVQYATQLSEGEVESALDKVIRQEILRDWESSLAAPHLSAVQDVILRHDRRDSVLITYIQILQRGSVKADGSPEQGTLLESGVVEATDGRIRVANKLYAEVFDLDWVEQQIPGITKPVTIISSRSGGSSASPSASAKLYSKWAIAACGVAVIGAAISSYIRESGGEAQAIPERLSESAALVEAESGAETGSVEAEAAGASGSESAAVNVTETSARRSDRELFDIGEEHAKNSRWVLMMRAFCDISPESVYFASAQKDLARWKELYPDDLDIAVKVVSAEEGGQCSVANSIFAQ